MKKELKCIEGFLSFLLWADTVAEESHTQTAETKRNTIMLINTELSEYIALINGII